jgi:phosphosulfolactate synthase (CoM biosynthesis protein A)
LNLRIRKEQANSFRFWSLVRQLKDKGGCVCDNENKPKQTEEERHQKACKIINLANKTRQAGLDEVMMEANEIKSKMTPLPHSTQQIEKQKWEDLKRNEARQVRRSEAQRIRQAPERSRMSIEF